MTATQADVLEGAALLIEEHGWIQSRAQEGDTRLCVGTAVCVSAARLGYEGPSPFGPLVVYVFGGERPYDALIRWQDARRRTQAEVTDALRGTAKELRNVGR